MTLQQLRYFLATAHHGSFAGAADELLLKQPSVAEQVRRLEAELGVPLFARKRRRLMLTAAGSALRPYAEQALATCQDGADAVRAHRTLRGGVASFGLPRNAELYELTDLAAEMHARHPLVGMRLIGQNSVEVADAIREGTLEAGLVVLPVDDEGLEVEPVFRDEVLYATADAARAARPVALARRCSTARSCSTTPTTATPTRPAASSTAACSSSAAGSRRTSRSSTSRARCGWRRSASATRSSPGPRSTAASSRTGLHVDAVRGAALRHARGRQAARPAALPRHPRAALDRARPPARVRARGGSEGARAGRARAGRRRPG